MFNDTNMIKIYIYIYIITIGKTHGSRFEPWCLTVYLFIADDDNAIRYIYIYFFSCVRYVCRLDSNYVGGWGGDRECCDHKVYDSFTEQKVVFVRF